MDAAGDGRLAVAWAIAHIFAVNPQLCSIFFMLSAPMTATPQGCFLRGALHWLKMAKPISATLD
jgi:hypothetical protein